MIIPADKLFDVIDANIAHGCETFGKEVVDEIKDNLSIPVEYRTGPRGGVIVVRSKSGEHPRKETGKLQAAVDHFVFQSGSIVGVNVYDPVNYAGFLDPGMNRPIVTSKDEEFADKFAGVIVKAFEG